MESPVSSASGSPRSFATWRGLVVALTPIACLIFGLVADLEPGNRQVTWMAAVALLMAVWWMTEAIPLAATSLLPLVLLPLFGIMKGSAVATQYINHFIFLFIGGFIFAMAMQKWNLHRRIALGTLRIVGGGPKRVMLGFMGATWFLSMWISNTAATMMMVPIALAVLARMEEEAGVAPAGSDGDEDSAQSRAMRTYGIGLLIGIAWAASIGGIATLIGTPPNLSFARILQILFPGDKTAHIAGAPEITFVQWFLFAFPISLAMFGIAWLLLTALFARGVKAGGGDREVIREEYRALGKMSWEEKWVACLFVLLALLWLTRGTVKIDAAGEVVGYGWSWLLTWAKLVPAGYLNDGTVAIAVALLLFIVPTRTRGERALIDEKTAMRLPWGIVLLFGGGFALASGFAHSGLSEWVGNGLAAAQGLHPVLLIALICLAVTFLTELTSNTATTEMILPILGAGAVAANLNPLLLMVPATLAASCAFMLPVATPPNAIVFGTERIRVWQMARVGLILNLIGVVVITAAIYALGIPLLEIDPAVKPPWAVMPKTLP